MSTASLYSGAINTAGQRAPAASFVSKALAGAQAGFKAPVAAPAAAYPWLTANIRRNMSVRAQRLMRADY